MVTKADQVDDDRRQKGHQIGIPFHQVIGASRKTRTTMRDMVIADADGFVPTPTLRNSRFPGEARESVEGDEPRNNAHSKISGHAGSVPGEDTQRQLPLQLIDTTTCIGWQGMRSGVHEWNDLPFGENGFGNTYQTMRRRAGTTEPDSLQTSQSAKRHADVADAQEISCMHCASRVPGACPRTGLRAVHQRIAILSSPNCIGCGYCITGCPFDIPKMKSED